MLTLLISLIVLLTLLSLGFYFSEEDDFSDFLNNDNLNDDDSYIK